MTRLQTPHDVFAPMLAVLDAPWGDDWLHLAGAWNDAVYLDELIGRDKPIKPILRRPDFFNASGMRVHTATWRQPMPTHMAQLGMGVCYRTNAFRQNGALLRCFASKLACAVGLPHLPEVLVPKALREKLFGSVVSLGLGPHSGMPSVTVRSLFQIGVEDALRGTFNGNAAADILRKMGNAERYGGVFTITDVPDDSATSLVAHVHNTYSAPHQALLEQKYAFDYMVENTDPNVGNILLARTLGGAHAILFIDTHPEISGHKSDRSFFSQFTRRINRVGVPDFARAMEVPFAEMAQRLTDDVIDETAEQFMRKLQRADWDVIRTHVAATKDRRDRAVSVARQFAMK